MKGTLEVELKHCPFCGKNVDLISCYKSQGFIEMYVRCPSCGHLFYEKHEYALKAWNRRVSP
ncbi:MAG: Lar family restriction alleviation protein [Synergistaceae bacterium]|nr:Lar family restriction alleviation protein [Synergistaceae bacterium]